MVDAASSLPLRPPLSPTFHLAGATVPFAVELYFDAETDDAVRRLWEALGRRGLNTRGEDASHPHLSLVVSDGHQPERLREELAGLNWAVLSRMRFAGIGYFEDPGVLFLAASPTVELLELQQQTHRIVSVRDPGLVRPFYRPGSWMPHCTLAMPVTPHELPYALEAIGPGMEIVEARITGLGMWSLADHEPWKLELDGIEATDPTVRVVDLRDRTPPQRIHTE
ncbi:MAG: hypothetical protein R2754_08820 [Microthrixaceae bacterium]